MKDPASSWFVISQIKSNIHGATFFPFLDELIEKRVEGQYNTEAGEAPSESDDGYDGLNRARKDTYRFCKEKIKSKIPRVSLIKDRTRGENFSTSSQSTNC